MKLDILPGTTSQIVHVHIRDNSITSPPFGMTGLTSSSSGLKMTYMRQGATAAVNVATINSITTLGTYAGSATQGAFKEVSSSNWPGLYEVHIPDNAIATGAKSVAVTLFGVTNMVETTLEIQLGQLDMHDTAWPYFHKSAAKIIPGTVSGSPTTTSVPASDLPSSIANSGLNGRIVIFAGNTTAAIKGQARDITGFNGSTKTLTLTALTDAPAVGDLFVIL